MPLSAKQMLNCTFLNVALNPPLMAYVYFLKLIFFKKHATATAFNGLIKVQMNNKMRYLAAEN